MVFHRSLSGAQADAWRPSHRLACPPARPGQRTCCPGCGGGAGEGWAVKVAASTHRSSSRVKTPAPATGCSVVPGPLAGPRCEGRCALCSTAPRASSCSASCSSTGPSAITVVEALERTRADWGRVLRPRTARPDVLRLGVRIAPPPPMLGDGSALVALITRDRLRSSRRLAAAEPGRPTAPRMADGGGDSSAASARSIRKRAASPGVAPAVAAACIAWLDGDGLRSAPCSSPQERQRTDTRGVPSLLVRPVRSPVAGAELVTAPALMAGSST